MCQGPTHPPFAIYPQSRQGSSSLRTVQLHRNIFVDVNLSADAHSPSSPGNNSSARHKQVIYLLRIQSSHCLFHWTLIVLHVSRACRSGSVSWRRCSNEVGREEGFRC